MPGGSSLQQLMALLEESQALGFLGPGALEPQVRHARGFADAARTAGAVLRTPSAPRFLDLGAGGGIPGLVLSVLEWSGRGVLVEANHRRATFLAYAVASLALADRITVVTERAEVAAHDPALREAVDVVVSRSFGPPAVTAECGGPFLARGGLLIVSEPPVVEGGTPLGDRWDVRGMAGVGLGRPLGVRSGGAGFVVVQRTGDIPASLPRRTGVPRKRPLF